VTGKLQRSLVNTDSTFEKTLNLEVSTGIGVTGYSLKEFR